MNIQRHTILITQNMIITNKIAFNTLTALMVVAFMMCNVTTLRAQDTPKEETSNPVSMDVDQEKDRRVEIPSETLPNEISEDLLANYSDAEIIKAWKWVNDEGFIEKYEVHLNKQGLDMRLEYDKKGKALTLEKDKE